jgi:glutamate-1-semialdehyde 2,1-aminomutase
MPHELSTDVPGLDGATLRALRDREARRFDERTRRSAELLRRAEARLPSGVPMAWMANLYPHAPLVADRGEGPRFWDVDGNGYLDFNLCDLSTPAGFTPQPVVEAIQQQAARGVQFLLPTPDAEAVAELLAARFGLPYWQLTLAASSANVEALRLARFATGRPRVLLFAGRYHGHIDDTLAAQQHGVLEQEGLGLAPGAGRHSTLVEFNDLEAVESELARGDVAAVLTEPALTNCTLVVPEPGFHEGLRTACSAHGTLLVIDETHTQAALYGGGTRRFGLDPDIVTGGKGIAGGVPIGVYGMRQELAGLMSANQESAFGDVPGLATGGTLFANALCLAAARAGLERVLTEEALGRVEQLGARLADGLDAQIAAHGLPWCAHRFGGRSGICLFPRPPRNGSEGLRSIVPLLVDARKLYLANRGVWDAIPTSGPSVSVAHTPEHVDEYLAVHAAFLDEACAIES